MRAWFPDLRALSVVVPLSIYSVGEPGFVPLTLGLIIAWVVLFVRRWNRGGEPHLTREASLLVLGVFVLFGSLIFAATPSLAFRASRGAMRSEAEAILAGDSAREQGPQFIGVVPVWSIRRTSCERNVVFFVTLDAAFLKEGYAYSSTPLPIGEPTCTYSPLGDGWYWARLNYG